MAKKKCKHSIFNKNCESCNQLKGNWYAKLGQFNGEIGDIEKDEDHLKIWSADKFRQRHAGLQNGGWQAKAEYYQLARQFLSEYKFDKERNKVIWEYHAEGLTLPEIVDTLKKAKVKQSSRATVKSVIKMYKAKMFDLYLSPKKEYHE